MNATEAAIKEEGTPFMKSFRKEMERRDETRRMRLEAMKGGNRKTVDEYADDQESESEVLYITPPSFFRTVEMGRTSSKKSISVNN